jgi:hypothetical protein
MASPTADKVKTPLPHQATAIQCVVSKAAKQSGDVLLGGTGAGKTLASLEIAKAIVSLPLPSPSTFSPRSSQGRTQSNRVLAIIPPLGGSVIKQWTKEAIASGWTAQSVLTYYGAAEKVRRRMFHKWDLHANDHPDVPHIFITSIDILLSESKGIYDGDRKKLTIEDIRSSAYHDIAPLFGKFRVIIVDEFQDFKNGSSAYHDDIEVDPAQIKYNVLNEFVNYNRPQFLLGLSATPIVNRNCDLYSFRRLFLKGSKELWTYREGYEKFSGHADASSREIESFKKTYFTEISKMEAKVNDTVITDIKHGLTADEMVLLQGASDEAIEKANKLMRKISEAAINPCAETRSARIVAEKKYNTAMTRFRRGMVHPAFFAKPVRSETEFEEDKYGNKIYYFDHATGRDLPIMKIIKPPIDELYQKWPIAKCSKMMAILNRIAAIDAEDPNTRIVVCLHWAEPLQLLARYAKDRFPHKSIFEHHGLASRRPAQAMEAFAAPFHKGPILLATTPGIDRGVDIAFTTKGADGNQVAVRMITGDLPYSAASEGQLHGRIKRLPAQGYPDAPDRVRNWYVDRILTDCGKATVEDFFLKLIAQKSKKMITGMTTAEETLEAGLEVAEGAKKEKPELGSLALLLDTLGYVRPDPAVRETRKRAASSSAGSSSAADAKKKARK